MIAARAVCPRPITQRCSSPPGGARRHGAAAGVITAQRVDERDGAPERWCRPPELFNERVRRHPQDDRHGFKRA